MIRAASGPRYAALALAILGLACGDASTAPDRGTEQAVVVSLVGIAANDAGIVLRLNGGVDRIEAAHASLEVAWADDQMNGTTVAIVGPLSESSDVLVVRRRAGSEPLHAVVLELAGADGAVSLPTSARAILRVGTGQ